MRDEVTDAHETDNQHHYESIAQAIALMRQSHPPQADLRAIAQHLHLSEDHIQHRFIQWAGTSPAHFSQYLTLEYAKSKIAETKQHLAFTSEASLSNPSRSDAPLVALDVMSPEEYKARGTGLTIRYGIHDSPFGCCVIATTPQGICNLHFLDYPGKGILERMAEQPLQIEWAQAKLIRDQRVTGEMGDRIFSPTPDPSSPLVLHVKGTNFQVHVWQALLSIPFAGITTYRGLAELIGRPTAARAIGTAIGRNPVGYVIPCHRVIRESGEMGGYRWGLERKAALLGWEASHHQ